MTGDLGALRDIDAVLEAIVRRARQLVGCQIAYLASGEVIGVLFVGDRYVRAFRPWELSILSTLAAHATVAILNAQAFEDAQAALEQASRPNAQLRLQAEGIDRAAAAHEELTALVAQGGGLADLCRLVARMLGGTVLLVDGAGHPLEGPTPPAGAPGAVPARRAGERIRQALRESRVLGRSVAAPGGDGEPCRVSVVIGGSGTLGGLVIWTPAELDEFAIRIFERSAMVTGVVLLSQERTALAANADRSAILRALLSGPAPARRRRSAGSSRRGSRRAGGSAPAPSFPGRWRTPPICPGPTGRSGVASGCSGACSGAAASRRRPSSSRTPSCSIGREPRSWRG